MIGYSAVYIDYRDMKCVIYCTRARISCTHSLATPLFFFYSSMGDALFFYTTKHVFLDPIILHTFIANFDKKILNEYYKYTYQFILHVQVFVEQSNTLTDYSL